MQHTDKQVIARALRFYLDRAHWGKGDPERTQVEQLLGKWTHPPSPIQPRRSALPDRLNAIDRGRGKA